MLLRIRVRLPDRPGSLGRVARTLGAAGADVTQMTVLERDNGRALDDFTVAWPAGAGIDRLCDGLGSVPGVQIVGVWPTAEPQGGFPDAAVLGQVAADPGRGVMILADAVPALLSADWAGLAEPGEDEQGRGAALVYTSVGGVPGGKLPPLWPLRPRAFTASDGTQYAVVPISSGTERGLVLAVARTGAPPFHRTEVSQLAQLVGAAEAVLNVPRGPAGDAGDAAGDAAAAVPPAAAGGAAAADLARSS